MMSRTAQAMFNKSDFTSGKRTEDLIHRFLRFHFLRTSAVSETVIAYEDHHHPRDRFREGGDRSGETRVLND